MSEFKGTKGSWRQINTMGNKQDKDCFYKVVRNENSNAIAEVKGVHYGIPNEECIYNALLISKAPEMLEMLIKLRDKEDWDINDFMDIEQLIKEATEL